VKKRARSGRARLASIGVAILAFALLSGLAAVLFKSTMESDRLVSRNNAERIMNTLFASLRDHDDFGSAIESINSLKERVLGVGVYAESGERVYAWGETPAIFSRELPEEEKYGEMVRKYIDNPTNNSIVVLLRPPHGAPPPLGLWDPKAKNKPDRAVSKEGDGDKHNFLSTTLRKGEIVYLEIREPEFWAKRRFETILFPVIEILLAALVVFIRSLILRNNEYQERIEEQKNLVVLGTAASTLAHEIKNPLLSIRLQTRILEKTCPPVAMREIGIINDEVERLSALSHRVGDYLRDPAGNPRRIDAADVALEVGMRLCGRNILKVPESAPPISMDPERLRSVLENLLRNALESGGPEESVSIEVGKLEDKARIDVLDRGTGLAPEAEARMYDPFFTTKSRGTGIGLSVCRRFVAAVGGSIGLANRPGGGCRARVLIPSAEAAT
jgi:two-component system, NtrC family, sensor histidine kinase HydH